MFDNISKSMVYFIKNAISSTVLAMNPNSAIARMNLPDNTSGRLQTPFCSVRIANSILSAFTKADGSREKYGYFNVSAIILGDTFTSVATIKKVISDALDSKIRIPIYEFNLLDTPVDIANPIAYALQLGGEESTIIGSELPSREYDSVVFRIRVKIT